MVPRYMSFCLGLVLGTLYEAVLGLDLPPAIVAYHARLPDVIMGEAVVLWLTMVVSGSRPAGRMRPGPAG